MNFNFCTSLILTTLVVLGSSEQRAHAGDRMKLRAHVPAQVVVETPDVGKLADTETPEITSRSISNSPHFLILETDETDSRKPASLSEEKLVTTELIFKSRTENGREIAVSQLNRSMRAASRVRIIVRAP